jgi:hypothetical protein
MKNKGVFKYHSRWSIHVFRIQVLLFMNGKMNHASAGSWGCTMPECLCFPGGNLPYTPVSGSCLIGKTTVFYPMKKKKFLLYHHHKISPAVIMVVFLGI